MNFEYAHLEGAYFGGAQLDRVDFYKARLTDIIFWGEIESIKDANIFGVIDPPDSFVVWAKENGAVEFEGDAER